MPTNMLRNLPSVSELLDSPQVRGLIDRVNRNSAVNVVRSLLDEVKTELQTAASERTIPSVTELAEKVARKILSTAPVRSGPVVNATGYILHRGLSSPPLAEPAIEAMVAAARDYHAYAIDAATSTGVSEAAHVHTHPTEELLLELTGAEAALALNSHCGASLLAASAVAGDQELLIARGHLGELSGRPLAKLLISSGAELCEVGSTNRTSLDDYAREINEHTAAIVHFQSSSYCIAGDAQCPSLEELVALARRHRIAVIQILECGTLLDLARLTIENQPLIADSVRAGASLTIAAGDKLIGGPASGLVVGKHDLVQQMARHPLAGSFCLDRSTEAALAATLRLYRQADDALREIPVLQLVSTSVANLEHRAKRIAAQMSAIPGIAAADAVTATTHLSSAGLAGTELRTCRISVQPAQDTPERVIERLRTAATPILAGAAEGRVLFDLRSVFPRQDHQLIEALAALAHVEPPAAEPAPATEQA